jgi:carboxypeptidase Q
MSMRLLLLALLALSIHASVADPIDPATRAGAAQILNLAESLKDSCWQRLAFMCDTFGPRFSGSPALESALDHIVSLATSDGLKVTQEAVMIPRWVRGREHARLVSPSVREKTLNIVGLGESIGTNNTRHALCRTDLRFSEKSRPAGI